MRKAYLNWSSGKDAAYALYLIQQQKEFSVEKLVTTINSENERVSMHGLRKDLLLKQAQSLGIPLQLISLPGDVPMSDYNDIMERETKALKANGFTHSIFGDIFLEDLKEYREQQLQKVGSQPVFPLWKKNTSELMQEFLSAGFKAITVSVNAKLLDQSFCGRLIDEKFLADLPKGVDPAGENGEFHSFVFDGPIFKVPVNFQKGEIVERSYAPASEKKDNCFKKEPEAWDTRFYYCDLK
ncbi:Dph6-related ATP pyrophosphatase [Salinimicrobium sediminilitoris]|uniref:Dph6-related ATP pyrophosphatase n=1 Tax=Salinimicrobium sediminilitoris TaxID=2876715 RepID=UPI001E58C4E2|nr:diphthine--ammonia ligase [Salinimicrobium sediminilitoris]MCC8359121.1 diphthine--ammonia ligase [Salinimicrobium sediminilitoris]